MPTSTPKARLVSFRLEELSGETLDQAVARLRASGMSWRKIAAYLKSTTGETVQDDSLGAWFPEYSHRGPKTDEVVA